MMTKSTHDKLIKQLEKVTKSVGYWQLAAGTAAGINSDWHDNAAYDHAISERDTYMIMEKDLKNRLHKAKIIQTPIQRKTIAIGHTILLEFNNGERQMHLLGPEDVNYHYPNCISSESELAKLLIGKKIGDEVVINESIIRVKDISIFKH